MNRYVRCALDGIPASFTIHLIFIMFRQSIATFVSSIDQ